jgi:hypothetical protein
LRRDAAWCYPLTETGWLWVCKTVEDRMNSHVMTARIAIFGALILSLSGCLSREFEQILYDH